jgi:hypothetical protein
MKYFLKASATVVTAHNYLACNLKIRKLKKEKNKTKNQAFHLFQVPPVELHKKASSQWLQEIPPSPETVRKT